MACSDATNWEKETKRDDLDSIVHTHERAHKETKSR
jgi:hypothetical protein